MEKQERLNLVAPCGLDCGICEVYSCRDNPDLKKILIGAGIPEDKLPCNGCKPNKGACAVLPGGCITYNCTAGKGLESCHECGDFPCGNLAPTKELAEHLPHNMKVFNLCTIKRDGLAEFIRQAQRIKDLYFNGKFVSGAGPELAE